MDKKTILFFLSLVIAIACLLIELLARDDLQNTSADYIEYLQTNHTTGSKGFFIFVSDFLQYLGIGIGLLLFIVSANQVHIMSVFLTFFTAWLGDIFKMTIAHPRPFWIDSNIVAMSCPYDFGAPSGHAFSVGSLIIYFMFVYLFVTPILSLVAGILTLALLALDRNYIGVHFYFQVVLGFSFATCVVLALNLDVAQRIFKNIRKKFNILITFEAVMGACYLLGILVYLFRDPYIDPEWAKNYESKCSGSFNQHRILFVSLAESSCIMINAGFFIGLYRFDPLKHLKDRKFYIIAVISFIVMVGAEQGLELAFKLLDDVYYFILISILRFLFGLFFPFVITKVAAWFEPPMASDRSPSSIIEVKEIS